MRVVTDDERREVARRLRGLRPGACFDDVFEVLGVYGPNPYESRVLSATWFARHLADLIEPSCDRDTPHKVAEEMFGKMRHSTKEEADAYDAILKSKSVEIHPADRDALLALADEMDHPIKQAVWNQTAGVRREHIMAEYARRIREALGVVA